MSARYASLVLLIASSALAQQSGGRDQNDEFIRSVSEYADRLKEKVNAEIDARTPEQKQRWEKLGVAAGEGYLVYRGLRNRVRARAFARGSEAGAAEQRAAAQAEIAALRAEMESGFSIQTVTGRTEASIKKAIEAKLGGSIEMAQQNGGRPLVRVTFVDVSEMKRQQLVGLTDHYQDVTKLVEVNPGEATIERVRFRANAHVGAIPSGTELHTYPYGIEVKIARVAQWGSVTNFDTKGVAGFVDEIADRVHAGLLQNVDSKLLSGIEVPNPSALTQDLKAAMKAADLVDELVTNEIRFAAKAAAQAVEGTGEVATQARVVEVVGPVSAEEAAVRRSWWRTSITGNTARLAGALIRKIPKGLWLYAAGDLGVKCYNLAETGDTGGWSPAGPAAWSATQEGAAEVSEACVNLWSQYGWGGTYYKQ